MASPKWHHRLLAKWLFSQDHLKLPLKRPEGNKQEHEGATGRWVWIRPIQPEELAVTSVYRIDIEEWSGKQKVAPADHPWAFHYEDLPTLCGGTAL